MRPIRSAPSAAAIPHPTGQPAQPLHARGVPAAQGDGDGQDRPAAPVRSPSCADLRSPATSECVRASNPNLCRLGAAAREGSTWALQSVVLPGAVCLRTAAPTCCASTCRRFSRSRSFRACARTAAVGRRGRLRCKESSRFRRSVNDSPIGHAPQLARSARHRCWGAKPSLGLRA